MLVKEKGATHGAPAILGAFASGRSFGSLIVDRHLASGEQARLVKSEPLSIKETNLVGADVGGRSGGDNDLFIRVLDNGSGLARGGPTSLLAETTQLQIQLAESKDSTDGLGRSLRRGRGCRSLLGGTVALDEPSVADDVVVARGVREALRSLGIEEGVVQTVGRENHLTERILPIFKEIRSKGRQPRL